MKYHANICGGNGGETTLDAHDDDDAMRQAVEWAREGDYPEDGAADVEVRVWRQRGSGRITDEATTIIEIEPFTQGA